MSDYMKFAQIMTLILSVASMIYVLYWAHTVHKWGVFTIPIFLYLLHQAVFYSTVLYSEIILGNKIDVIYNIPALGEQWSAILRTHGTVTILFAAITVKFQIQRFFRGQFLGLLEHDNNS